MLLPEVKEQISRLIPMFVEQFPEIHVVGPEAIISGLIEELVSSCQKIAPHLTIKIRNHVKNLEENRKEAEQLVAGLLEYR